MPWAADSEARSEREYMCRARDAMATTSLVAVKESENGLFGRGMVTGSFEGFERWWICIVESHEADISMFWDRA